MKLKEGTVLPMGYENDPGSDGLIYTDCDGTKYYIIKETVDVGDDDEYREEERWCAYVMGDLGGEIRRDGSMEEATYIAIAKDLYEMRYAILAEIVRRFADSLDTAVAYMRDAGDADGCDYDPEE